MIRVGINGFGRIGRIVLRAGLEEEDIEFVAVNDIADAATLTYLLKYDSVHGRLSKEITCQNNTIIIKDKAPIKVFSYDSPEKVPWQDVGVDVVVEATGKFTDAAKARQHIRGSVKKVIITAPAKDEDITIVMGVNERLYDKDKHHIISGASCTTNCLAVMLKVLIDNFGVKRGHMTTIHAYTNDQRILDLVHKDLRRARAAGVNIIPTTTGAARAIGKVIPSLAGKLTGIAIRVPTSNVSLTDLVVELSNSTTKEEINNAYKESALDSLRKYLCYQEEPLVSSDFNGSSYSAIIDGLSTSVVDNNLAEILAWYDNEWGYSCRIIDLIKICLTNSP